MVEFTQSTVTREPAPSNVTKVIAPTVMEATQYQTSEYLIYFLFGLIDALLGFRFLFKLAGANPNSGFVNLIYSITNLLQLPFNGIFGRVIQKTDQVISIFEPSTIVAILIYSFVAWGIVKLVRISSGEKQSEI